MKTFSLDISKIKSWQQVISAIAIFSVVEIASVLKPETALHSTSIGLALILLMFYIVKRSTVINNARENLDKIKKAKREGYIEGIIEGLKLCRGSNK